MVGFMCYVNGRIDPTQFFYNLMVIFDTPPDLHTLKRSIEQHVAEDGVCTDGGDYIVSEIEILDFRTNTWVNLESRAQLYSGCQLTSIRSLMGASCSGAIDRSRKTSLQKVLGFALEAQRMFEVLDADDEGKIRLKGLLRVLRHDVDYAVDVFSFLDKSSEGAVTFQTFLLSFNDFTNRPFFDELQRRISVGGKPVVAEAVEDGDSTASRQGVPSPTSVGGKTSMLANGISMPPRAQLPATAAANEESSGGPSAPDLTAEEKAKALRVVELFRNSARKATSPDSARGAAGGGEPKVSEGVLNRLKNLARNKAAAARGAGDSSPTNNTAPFGSVVASSSVSTASSNSKKGPGSYK